MARLRHNVTGVVANFPDEEVRSLSAGEWSLVEPVVVPAPTRKRQASKPDVDA